MKLTDEQIAELAPDWATHYRFNSFEVMYESTKKWMAIGLEFPYIKRGPYRQDSKLTKCKPIPRKPFDISEHEFSDTAKDCGVEFNVPAWVYPDIEINVKDITGGDNTALLMKEHAIAIAKHFKLTAEDLK